MIPGLRMQFILLFDNLVHLVVMLIIITLNIFFINMTDVILSKIMTISLGLHWNDWNCRGNYRKTAKHFYISIVDYPVPLQYIFIYIP
jgi:hypothetical protein